MKVEWHANPKSCRPPAIRLGSPIPLPGFPADFQPICHAEVTFNVNASTFYGENIVLLGSAYTLGEGNIWNAVSLSADDYPIWSATVDITPNTHFSYQYARAEPGGTYVYENVNRTLTSGPCGSDNQTTHDTITTSSPPQSSSKKARRGVVAPAPVQLYERQSSGSGNMLGLPGRDLINPPYKINNLAGSLSNKTLDTDLAHYGGYKEYDTHNLFGAMMSETSRVAMLSRRPTVRPLVITRSTFAGSGRQVGHWLGDNNADWSHYLISVAGLLEFGALFQLPMVGSDVCGYAGVTNKLLCARWATLGAFSTFYRNHETSGSPPHEFYRWPLVAQAARNAISIRYKLLDFIYTAMYEQNQTGTPVVQPMFFHYPSDPHCNSLQYQYFYGPGIMVAPVTIENSTTLQVYMPDNIFYDYYTHATVRGNGSVMEKEVGYTDIALFYEGGSIIAERANSANTTTELRKQNFAIIIAPGLDGSASGSLYLDDGESLVQPATSFVQFEYTSQGSFSMTGNFGYDSGVVIESVTVLGSGSSDSSTYGEVALKSKVQSKTIPLTGPYEMHI